MDSSSESAIDSLPDEVLLLTFRFLSLKQLLTAEQVCLRWKAVVNTCFATAKTVKLKGPFELKNMKRYGPSVKCLGMCQYYVSRIPDNVDWIAEIVSISLDEVPIGSESLNDLPVKCCRITRISLSNCSITDKDLEIVFKGFPGLKSLNLTYVEGRLEECFRELGSNLQHLTLTGVWLTPAGISDILSKCTNVQSLTIDNEFDCDAHDFSTFCKSSPLRQLSIDSLELSNEVFLSISHLSLLEDLVLHHCRDVDSDVLIRISLGCPNLKNVDLFNLPLVCDRGIKCFAQCKHLTSLECSSIEKMSDESLFDIAKACVLLETLEIVDCGISDQGLSAILTQCPRLDYLSVRNCSGVGDDTVDAAIRAVESRSLPLCLCVSGKGFSRYKDGFSHPLLLFEIPN